MVGSYQGFVKHRVARFGIPCKSRHKEKLSQKGLYLFDTPYVSRGPEKPGLIACCIGCLSETSICLTIGGLNKWRERRRFLVASQANGVALSERLDRIACLAGGSFGKRAPLKTRTSFAHVSNEMSTWVRRGEPSKRVMLF